MRPTPGEFSGRHTDYQGHGPTRLRNWGIRKSPKGKLRFDLRGRQTIGPRLRRTLRVPFRGLMAPRETRFSPTCVKPLRHHTFGPLAPSPARSRLPRHRPQRPRKLGGPADGHRPDSLPTVPLLFLYRQFGTPTTHIPPNDRPATHLREPRRGGPDNSPGREPRDTDPHQPLSIPARATQLARSRRQPGGPSIRESSE